MNRTIAVVLAALLLLGIACPRRSSRQALIVGIIAPSLDHLPLSMIPDRESIGVFQRFNSGWELGEALVAGKVDVAIIPFTYVISAQDKGVDIRIISCLEHEDDGIIARPGIERLSDLEGKRIGCLKASTIELLLRRTLNERGISAELVYFSSPMEMYAALENGAVAALSYYVPGIIKANRKIGTIIHWYADDWPMHPCCDVAVNVSCTKAKRSSLTRFMTALAQGTQAIARDTARAVTVAAKQFSLSDSVALESIRRTPFRMSLTAEEKEFELSVARQMKELGYIKSEIRPDRLYLKGYAPH